MEALGCAFWNLGRDAFCYLGVQLGFHACMVQFILGPHNAVAWSCLCVWGILYTARLLVVLLMLMVVGVVVILCGGLVVDAVYARDEYLLQDFIIKLRILLDHSYEQETIYVASHPPTTGTVSS